MLKTLIVEQVFFRKLFKPNNFSSGTTVTEQVIHMKLVIEKVFDRKLNNRSSVFFIILCYRLRLKIEVENFVYQ